MIEFHYEAEMPEAIDMNLICPVIERIFSDHQRSFKEMNVVFMSDDELLEINQEFLKHDYYTDIITFNYSESPDLVEPELYISVDRVKENAVERNIPFKDELFRVIIHGSLHLCGYDDYSDTLKSAMQVVEDKYLNV
jgi:rRNA maturation RNase YbeY